MELLFGIPLLIIFMAVVMGMPFAYFWGREQAYERTEGQPESVRLNAWYN